VDGAGATVSTSGSVATGATISLNGSDTECTVVNTFVANAKINIASKIIGGNGAISADASFVTANSLTRSETTDSLNNTAWGDAGTQDAKQTGLAFGTYDITGAAPTNTTTSSWSLDSLICTGGASYSIQDANVSLELDSSSNSGTEISCTYTWKLTALADATINKISIGDTGTFTLNAESDGTQHEGDVTTSSTGVAAEALKLLALPQGTLITLGESNLPTPIDGQWNPDTGGDPTWECVDSANNPIAINGANQIMSTVLDVTCTATNTYAVDPTPTPTPTPEPEPSESATPIDPDGPTDPREEDNKETAYDTGGKLPNTGGEVVQNSVWSLLWHIAFTAVKP